MSKRQINVVGAVIVRDGLILAAKRGAAMSLAGFWEFPGGKIEHGETHEEALARELTEELHIEARIGKHIETTSHEYDFGVVNLSTYYTELVSGEPVLTEHEEVRWLAPSELDSVDWAPADIPAIEKISSDFNAAE